MIFFKIKPYQFSHNEPTVAIWRFEVVRHYSLKFLLPLLLLNTFPGLTQNTVKTNTQYLHGFRQYTIKDGLASDDVRQVLSDQKGFIWIATEMGLDRFDGRTFMHFSAVQHGLRSDNIQHIIEDGNKRLWVCSEKENRFFIDLIDLTTLAVTPLEAVVKNLPNSNFSDFEYRDGWVYLSAYLNDVSQYRVNMELEASLSPIKEVTKTKQDKGVTKIIKRDPVSGRSLSITSTEVWILDANQRIIGGPGASIYQEMPGVQFHHPYFDQQGNSWIPTVKHGLVYLHLKEKVFRTASPSPVDDPIFARKLILNQPIADAHHHIWLANKALHSYNPQQGKAYRWELDAPFKLIKAHATATNDLLLLVVNENLATYHLFILNATKKQWTAYPLPNISPLESTISALFKDSRDIVWIGTNQGEVIHTPISPSKNPILKQEDLSSLKSFPIRQFESTNEGVWISSAKGLFLYKYEAGITQIYNNTAESPIKIFPKIRGLFAMSNGDLWITSKGYGFGKLNIKNKTFQQFTKVDGLRNDITHLIVRDAKDIIWVTNRNGLNQLSILNGKIRSIQLADQTYNNVYDDAAAITPDGRLLFSSTTSVLSFQPNDLLGNYNTRVTISGLSHLDSETRLYQDQLPEFLETQQITVYPHQTFLTVDFALLDFYQPLYHQYEYQIEGLNETWVSTRENSLQLGGLPYGNFRFKVRIANEYGKRASEEINVPLVILKPFYLETWFILLTALSSIGLIYGLLQWRTWRLIKSKQQLKEAVNIQTEQLQQDKLIIEQQAEELRQLDQTKSRFFANVSHELRTPLTLILSPIQSILKSNELNNRNETWLRMAQQNGQRLLKLTNEILDLTKLEADKLTINRHRVVLFLFLKRIIAAFQSHAESKGIELLFQYELEKTLLVKIDSQKTETILINLLSNALKFTPSKGQVIITAKDHQKHLEVSVQDTGRGIHPNDLPHIFNRFFQTKQSNSQAEGGTGIGLALSQEFAKLMEGNLGVTSELNHGSTFTLSLPYLEVIGRLSDEEAKLITGHQAIAISQAQQQKPSANKSSSSTTTIENTPTHKSSILLVEDNNDLRQYIYSLLSGKYQVLTAENGQVALDYLSANKVPNLIISDIMMPIMDGYQLLQILKTSEQFRFLPVIMLTALANADDKLKALRIGVDDYMLKPFSEAELLARVHNLLQHATLRQTFLEKETVSLATTDELATEKEAIPIELSESDQAWLTQLEQTTLKNIGNFNCSVEQLATEMTQSRWQFNRRLKGLTGLTARQYLLETRLNQARTLLEQRAYDSVKAVTYTVGIKDLQHFSRQFKERFGKLPSEYL